MQKSLLLLVSLFYCAPLFPMFCNMGTMSSKNLDINHGYLKNDGTLEGRETADIIVKILDGTGIIKGNKVTIKCEEFKYSGMIDAKECIIYAKQPFDASLFKRNADGKYTIIIVKN